MEGPPADQRALRISNAPSTHLFRLDRRHRFTTRHRHAAHFAHITGKPHFFSGGHRPAREAISRQKRIPTAFAPQPQPPRSGRRPPFSQTVDRRSDAAVCQSGAFTKTTAVYLHGKKINYLFRPGTFTGEFRIRYAAQTGAEALQACIAWKRAARRAASVDFTAVIFSSRRTAVSPPADGRRHGRLRPDDRR